MAIKYQFPSFLEGVVPSQFYSRWLGRKARAHRSRDRDRGNSTATIEEYKIAIHSAVLRSNGVDAYTGQPLRWDLISKYDNEASKAGRRTYKRQFGDLPSVDHIGDGLSAPDFLICAWRTNDAKNDLSYDDFVALCRAVLAHEPSIRGSAIVGNDATDKY
jgi:hypothetical protein